MKHKSKITVYRNSKPVSGIRVTLEYTGWSQSGFTSPAFTDSNGVAIIEHASTGPANIWIDGARKGQMNTPGGDLIYL